MNPDTNMPYTIEVAPPDDPTAQRQVIARLAVDGPEDMPYEDTFAYRMARTFAKETDCMVFLCHEDEPGGVPVALFVDCHYLNHLAQKVVIA